MLLFIDVTIIVVVGSVGDVVVVHVSYVRVPGVVINGVACVVGVGVVVGGIICVDVVDGVNSISVVVLMLVC